MVVEVVGLSVRKGRRELAGKRLYISSFFSTLERHTNHLGDQSGTWFVTPFTTGPYGTYPPPPPQAKPSS